MKFVTTSLALFVVYLSVISGTFQLSSCTKKQIVQDTVIVRDTLTVRDTTVVRDTTRDTTYDLTEGLVAYYNFNGGNLNDSSGYNNNIIFNNATLANDRFGIANNAYLFDGSTSYMEVTNSASLNPGAAISLMAIVKVNSFNTATCHDNQILGKLSSDPTDGIYALRFNDITADCSTSPNTSIEEFSGEYGDNNPQGSDASVVSDSVTLKTGQWYNVVFTYDGVYARMYINGSLKNIQPKAVPFTANNVDLFIGKTPNPSFPYFFNGVIDEIRIYNLALSPGAVKQLNSVKE